MPTILDDIRTRVRKRSSYGGASGLADVPFLENIKSTRALIQREGFIGVGQKAIAGERPIMSKVMPQQSSMQRYRELRNNDTPPSRRKWDPINIVS